MRPQEATHSAPPACGGARQGVRWGMVVVYAVAMAWVEAAVVFYLRTIGGNMNPYVTHPLRPVQGLALAELIREAATLVMLFAVGWLAGRTTRSRLAYFLIGFGVWDIFYYVFLAVLTGWPRSLLDWDILFLLPLPWWGPVLAPILIALLMVLGGTLVVVQDQLERPVWPGRWAVAVSLFGAVLALYVFMADALRTAGQGIEALQHLLPVWFNWPLFLLALVFLSAPVAQLARGFFAAKVKAAASSTANGGGQDRQQVPHG